MPTEPAPLTAIRCLQDLCDDLEAATRDDVISSRAIEEFAALSDVVYGYLGIVLPAAVQAHREGRQDQIQQLVDRSHQILDALHPEEM